MILGIDAANLRQGGGRTHLVELLRAADPAAHGFERVVVWGSKETLATLDERPWLDRRSPPELEGGLVTRTWWQRAKLSAAAREAGCDLLFVPGGSYAGSFAPVVTMSQNLLPFEAREIARYGATAFAAKLLLLRRTQSEGFRRSDGVIFLTRYARDAVTKVTGPLRGETAVIPHGTHERFRIPPRPQRRAEDLDAAHPLELLYVSTIDAYKHPWNVVAAIASLRERHGWPLRLHLAGPAHARSLERLKAAISRHDPRGEWVDYHGKVPYDALHPLYARAEVGIFASSCENLPIILLETMAAGLPIACSDRGPMPEVLGDAGVYFDPEKPESIAAALERLIRSPEERARFADAAIGRAHGDSWERCARDTFAFLARVRDASRGHPRATAGWLRRGRAGR